MNPLKGNQRAFRKSNFDGLGSMAQYFLLVCSRGRRQASEFIGKKYDQKSNISTMCITKRDCINLQKFIKEKKITNTVADKNMEDLNSAGEQGICKQGQILLTRHVVLCRFLKWHQPTGGSRDRA